MNALHTLDQAEITGKRVIIRVDWNVTLTESGAVADDTRIQKTLATIKWVIEHGAKQIVLLSHLGKAEEKKSLKPVVSYAQSLVGENILLFDQFDAVPSGHLIMLENVRLWEGEDANDSLFAQKLATLGDLYIDEAFGEAHREAASIVGIPRSLPSFAGLQFAREVETILKVREHAEHPFVVVMGGAKVEDKIKLLDVLSNLADSILLGGKLANQFAISGLQLPGKARVISPVEGHDLFDIGPETQRLFSQEIAHAKTIVWNGPMGKVEDPQYRAGTEAIYDALTANEAAFTLVGGGDTLAAISRQEHKNRIDFISTGGGAMLKLLEKGTLPGIEVLIS
jgi:phosphoglycerate kinase